MKEEGKLEEEPVDGDDIKVDVDGNDWKRVH
jgi:hypothetical protein